jgi:hypothetical protein
MDTNKYRALIDQAAITQAVIGHAVTDQALKVQNIIKQLQYRQALLDEILKQQLDATPFTKNVPIDETPATNETRDTNEAPETSEASDTNEIPNEASTAN